jgi:Domain of unknown function (DUF4055)
VVKRSSIRYTSNRDAVRQSSELIGFLHPDYRQHKPDWNLIRDCVEGERRIKERGQEYLPPIGEGGQTYTQYLQRAVYVNMVGRTISGLLGTVFRRPVKLLKKTQRIDKVVRNISLNGYDLHLFSKLVSREVLTTGRVGVLVDRPGPAEEGTAYLTYYIADNILSWRTERREGREVLVYVLLREVVEHQAFLGETSASDPRFHGRPETVLQARYRVLRLDAEGKYVQEVYQPQDTNTAMSLDSAPSQTITPSIRGARLDYIPFVIIGPESPTAAIQKSPVLDIATLNIAHYRTSAQLESGRYFTAIPVYWTNVKPGDEGGDYTIGPSVVLELPPDSKLGIAEYYGSGLSHLAQSLLEKEQHISDLGGRVIHARAGESSMSDNAAQLKNINETSILTNLTESVSTGLTWAVRWLLAWEDFEAEASTVTVKLNQDFKLLTIGARELRAVALLHQEGLLPIQEVFRVLQENEYVGEDVSEEEFVAMIENLENFPGQPDVEAMHEGFPDAQARLTDEQKRRLEAQTENMQRADQKNSRLLADRAHDQAMEMAEHAADQQVRQTRALEATKVKTAVAIAKAKPKPTAKPAAKPAAKKPTA